jgi:hypothetical protein
MEVSPGELLEFGQAIICGLWLEGECAGDSMKPSRMPRLA